MNDLDYSALAVLTDREWEVLALIARGLTNPEIGVHLGIAVTTVRTHVDNIFIKLGVHGRGRIANLYWLARQTPASAEMPEPGLD
jgi:ATP/maltotriose-dependent transcriptional regulator MalT